MIWSNTTGDVLNAAQQTAFENYIRGGGGYVGLHSAADTEYEWPFYGQLVGAYFRNHPPGTPAADVHVTDPDDHSTQGLPATYNKIDEWYNYQSPVNPSVGGGGTDYNPRNTGVHVLMTVDESDYVEEDGSDGVDDEHPISWCRRVEGGRSWYTGMGHTAASYSEANYLSHILGGIETAAGEDVDSPECGADRTGRPARPGLRRADLRRGAARGAVQRDGDRPGRQARRPAADLQVGVRRRLQPLRRRSGAHVHEAGRLHGDADRDRQGRQDRDGHRADHGQPAATTCCRWWTRVADPASGTPPLTVDFEAIAIDPDGDESRITYRWDFGDGDGPVRPRGQPHVPQQAGEYTAKVTATDERGGSATKTLEIVIDDPAGNQPPTVQALADPKSGTAPLRVRLSSAPADLEDGKNLFITWNFGDGTPGGGGEAVFHTYTAPGNYTATVTVEDTGGLKATATVPITVTAPSGGQGLVARPGRRGRRDRKPRAGAPDQAPEARRAWSSAACATRSRATRRAASARRCGSPPATGSGSAATALRRIGAGDSRRLVLRLDRNVRRNLVSAMRKAKLRNLRATLVLKIRTADGTTTVRKAVVLRR